MAHPGGRPPRHDITAPKTLDKVRNLASQCMAEKNIAYCLGYSPEWFSKLKKEHPELVQALKEGHARGEERATTALLKEVDARSLGAICFYLKSKHGWRENAFGANDDAASGDTGTIGNRVLESVRRTRAARRGERGQDPTD